MHHGEHLSPFGTIESLMTKMHMGYYQIQYVHEVSCSTDVEISPHCPQITERLVTSVVRYFLVSSFIRERLHDVAFLLSGLIVPFLNWDLSHSFWYAFISNTQKCKNEQYLWLYVNPSMPTDRKLGYFLSDASCHARSACNCDYRNFILWAIIVMYRIVHFKLAIPAISNDALKVCHQRK